MIAKVTPFIMAATTLLACFPTDVCGCPPALGIGTVAGIVRRADGTPAVDAVVRASVSVRGCLNTESDLVDPGVVITGPAGTYRHELRAWAPSDSACVRLTALDTSGGRRDSVTVAGIRMRLIPSYGTRQRPDSVRIDLLLDIRGSRQRTLETLGHPGSVAHVL